MKQNSLKYIMAGVLLICLCIASVTAAPVAAFSGTPTSGSAPLTVTFKDASGGSPTGWAWFFGDEKYTEAWTRVNASAGWSGRWQQQSVVMPDGSIVLMGGYSPVPPYQKNDVWRSTDRGATWTRMNASAAWSARDGHTSVAMPDGSIVLMGGWDGGYKNDVWRSTDNGAIWTRVNASARWSPRSYHSSVVMPDGSIVLTGGYDGISSILKNDVWRSMDNGVTWTKVNASAGWSARSQHSSVAMPDGSIVLMGGYDISNKKNDTWRSTDNGTTWAQMTASAGWTARFQHSSVAMPDGSIVLMDGYDITSVTRNDVWRSTDNGAIWTRVNASAGWAARKYASSVVMPDGSIVLMGGTNSTGTFYNDVWRFQPTGSLAQNPSHTYTAIGTYPVALTVYNSEGYNSMRKSGYICAGVCVLPLPGYENTPTDPDDDGIIEDLNGNGRLDFADVVLYFNQMEWIAAHQPVSAFDLNGNGRIDFADIVKLFGEI